ncbi:hypothetical protein HPB47_027827, partial [Ixodes persulcatus]
KQSAVATATPSEEETVIAPSAFYGVPKTRPKRFLGKDNLLDNIDCNESDLSGESSSEECDPITEDSSDEDVESTDAKVETGVPKGDLKRTYANKRYTWKRCDRGDSEVVVHERATARTGAPTRHNVTDASFVFVRVLRAPAFAHADSVNWTAWEPQAMQAATEKAADAEDVASIMRNADTPWLSVAPSAPMCMAAPRTLIFHAVLRTSTCCYK